MYGKERTYRAVVFPPNILLEAMEAFTSLAPLKSHDVKYGPGDDDVSVDQPTRPDLEEAFAARKFHYSVRGTGDERMTFVKDGSLFMLVVIAGFDSLEKVNQIVKPLDRSYDK